MILGNTSAILLIIIIIISLKSKFAWKKNQLKKIELKIDFNQYKKLKFCDFSYFCKLWMVLTEKWNGKKSVINVKYVRKKY